MNFKVYFNNFKITFPHSFHFYSCGAGISSHSLHSIDSINSDAQDEMNASTLSLSSHAAPPLSTLPHIGSLSPGSSYETSASGYEPAPPLLRQRQARSSDKPKDCGGPSDFYSWWDENLTKDKVV